MHARPERGEPLDVERVERALEGGERAEDGGVPEGREKRADERVAERVEGMCRVWVGRGREELCGERGQGCELQQQGGALGTAAAVRKRGRVRTFALGFTSVPSTNTLRLFTLPPLPIHTSQSARSACSTRATSPEYRSSGQYPSATFSPCVLFMCACMQKRQVRVLIGRVSGERCVGRGRNPHFG